MLPRAAKISFPWLSLNADRGLTLWLCLRILFRAVLVAVRSQRSCSTRWRRRPGGSVGSLRDSSPKSSGPARWRATSPTAVGGYRRPTSWPSSNRAGDLRARKRHLRRARARRHRRRRRLAAPRTVLRTLRKSNSRCSMTTTATTDLPDAGGFQKMSRRSRMTRRRNLASSKVLA